MSAVIAVPEVMASAATDLATIGSTLSAAHLTAAPPTQVVLSAAADEVSTGVAHLFSQQAQDYQALAGKAAAFHEQFVQHLTVSAASHAGAEAANVAVLQPFNAIAGSIGALQDQAVNLFNAVQSQVLDAVNTFVGDVHNLWFNAVLSLVGISLFIIFLLIIALFASLARAPLS
jgi:hypothetical protein